MVTRAIVLSRTMRRADHPLFQQLYVTGEKEEAAEEAAQRQPDQPQREREQRQQRPEHLRSV